MNKILKFVATMCLATMFLSACVYAAKLDTTLPTFDPDKLNLQSDGTATFVPPTITGGWKKYELQLMVRQTQTNASTGLVTYQYKTQGSVKSVDAEDREYTFNFTQTGYYQFQIRGVDLSGNYCNWMAIYDNSSWRNQKENYPGVAVTTDDISTGGGSGSGSGSGYGWSDYNNGPGVVQTNPYPYNYQYVTIGPNGEILYNWGGNQSNYYQSQQQYQQGNTYYGPGFTNNNPGASQTLSPYTGISNYPQVPAPNINGNNAYQYNNQNGQTNPNYYNSGSATNPTNQAGIQGEPQITQALEIGWHVDNNGRFYYQGNGVVLKGTWYLIDGSFYRFSDRGYVLANQWYKDNTTGYWYFLAGDGRMLTGWQNLNGVWYYFKPENGNGYGSMYSNTSLLISDSTWGTAYYAFDSNGAMVRNAWYGGYYYGNDGSRKS